MKYSLGLDIGTASIGWAVVNLDKNRIEDLGVRIFERPEHPKSGESLAKPRRVARSARRRLRRRRQRLNYLKQFFISQKLLTKEQIDQLTAPNHAKGWHPQNPYALRVKGTTERLSPDELLVVLYHIAKRRGYKSNRKTIEEKDTTGEGKAVNSAIAQNAKVLSQYTTVGEALVKDDKFYDRKRNTTGDFRHSFARADFLNEIRRILLCQQRYYPNQLADDQIDHLLGIKISSLPVDRPINDNDINRLTKLQPDNINGLFYQRPFMTSDLINKMRGKCPLESEQPRAPKASYSFEIFRLAQDLAHLQYIIDTDKTEGDTEPTSQKAITKFLTSDQIETCINKCLTTKKVTYRAIREALGYVKNDPHFQFKYIRGKNPKDEEQKKDPLAKEKNTFAELKFYHSVKSGLKNLPDDWRKVDSNPELFDQIGEILTCNKDDYSIKEGLRKLEVLSDDAVDALLPIDFSGFGHLSLIALRNITPYLKEGNGITYDKAMEKAGYHFAARLSGDKTCLPPLNKDDAQQITNPVVKRAISQTIKVVNAIIRKYGSPYRIGVECAGELAKSHDERKKIKDAQDENAFENEKLKKKLRKEYNILTPTGTQITKFRLYKQQDGKCAYSGKPLDLDRLFDPGNRKDESYAEIDHIIPFSRCGNDTRANKVLVLNSYNQIKGNRTPYETWGNDPDFWQRLEANTKANPKLGQAKQRRLLTHTIPAEDWASRAINDTRYISKFISRYLKNYLEFSPYDESPNQASDSQPRQRQRVIMPAGAITTHLRRMWHQPGKNREADLLHHAVDATIIALTTQATIQDCAVYSAYIDDHTKQRFTGNTKTTGSARLLRQLERITNTETGEISQADYEELIQSLLPWPNFDQELRKRASLPGENDTISTWRDQFRDIYSDQDSDFYNHLHPIFVSRMPKRRVSGKTNKDTVYSTKTRDNDGKTRSSRVGLADLTLDKLKNSAIRNVDETLYKQLEQYVADRKKWLDENKKWKVVRREQKKLLKKSPVDEAVSAPAELPPEPIEPKIYKNGKHFDKNGNPISPIKSIKIYSPNPDTSGLLVNQGKAYVSNDSMVRLDVYKRPNKKGKIEHFFVPVYANMIRRGHPEVKPTRILPPPKKGIPPEIDDSFTFVCSLYPNDYVKVVLDGEVKEGYYAAYDIKVKTMKLLPHAGTSKDLPVKENKKADDDDQTDHTDDEPDDGDQKKKKAKAKHPNRYPAFRISPQSATRIERLDINVLGDNYKWM